MKLERFARVYQLLILVVVALTPTMVIWYMTEFALVPPPRLESQGLHEIVIAIAIVIGGFVSYVSWRSYCSSGEIFLRWLTAGFLVFTLVYAPHGLLTRLADHNIWLFLLYGPVSRLAMLTCLVYGLAQYGKEVEKPADISKRGFWRHLIIICVILNLAVAVLAYSPLASSIWVRMPMELGALFLCLITVGVMAWQKIRSPLMMFFAIALLFFGQAAIAFMLSKPWSHLWWLAHGIFAAGFTILSWGVVQALLTTRSFSAAYSQEELMRELEHERNHAYAVNVELQMSQVQLQTVLNGVQDCVVTIDKTGTVTSFNVSAENTFGYQSDEVVGGNVNMLMPEPYQSEHNDYLQRYDVTRENKLIGQVREVTGLRKDGSIFPMELWVSESIVNGEPIFTGSIRDITKIKSAGEQLRIAAAAFELQDAIIISDSNHEILRVNNAFTEVTGYTASEVIGQTPSILKSTRHNDAFYAEMKKKLNQTDSWRGEIWQRRKNGEEYPGWLTISTVKSEDGIITHYVSVHHDITDRKVAEDKILQLAFYDPLTKLANRRLLFDRLNQALIACKRNHFYGALMFLDLDNFKPLNDVNGHIIGDLLLKQVAKRLESCVRDIDTIARFGGDEFVVILSDLSEDKAKANSTAAIIAEKIRIKLAKPYKLVDGNKGKANDVVHHSCTASIGVVLFSGPNIKVKDIIKWADTAMFKAKEAGRNSVRFYDPNLKDN